MAWEENSCISLNMQLIAILSRIGVVYINRESYAYIKRFLAVTAPEMPISGFVNRIIDEHLKKYEHEMSKLYTECITKPL